MLFNIWKKNLLRVDLKRSKRLKSGHSSLDKLTFIPGIKRPLSRSRSATRFKKELTSSRSLDAILTHQFWNLLLFQRLRTSLGSSRWIFRRMEEVFGEHGLIEILDLQVESLSKVKMEKWHQCFGTLRVQSWAFPRYASTWIETLSSTPTKRSI